MTSFFSLFLTLALWLLPSSNAKKAGSVTRKRILSEWKEITAAKIDLSIPFNTSVHECGVRLSPLQNNLLEWHFSFTGMESSSYAGGIYHGRIILDPSYPEKAPIICVLTPSGRWEVNTPICLSASSHHQETWNPNWNLRTLVLSLRNFMTSQPQEIGSINSDVDTQRRLAFASQFYQCPLCGIRHSQLLLNSLSDTDNEDISAFHDNENNLLLPNDVMKSTLKKRSTSIKSKKKVDKGLLRYFGGFSLKSILLASSLVLLFLFQTGTFYSSSHF